MADHQDPLLQALDRANDALLEVAAKYAALVDNHAALTAERDAAMRVAVRVKPLVWEPARGGYPFKWQAWCDLMGGYYYAGSYGQKREHEAVRAARILATLEPAPVSDDALIRAAIEAAAEAAEGSSDGYHLDGAPEAIRALATTVGIAAIREMAAGYPLPNYCETL